MDQNETPLQKVKRDIRPFLREYLEGHGIEVRNDRDFIPCISRYHEEEEPSMHLMPNSDGTMLKCFGCGAAMDIFAVAHNLERLPMEGVEFVQDNVFVLADRFDVPHENIELSPEEIMDLIEKHKLKI